MILRIMLDKLKETTSEHKTLAVAYLPGGPKSYENVPLTQVLKNYIDALN